MMLVDHIAAWQDVFHAAQHLRDWEMMDAAEYRVKYGPVEPDGETDIIEALFAAVKAAEELT